MLGQPRVEKILYLNETQGIRSVAISKGLIEIASSQAKIKAKCSN